MTTFTRIGHYFKQIRKERKLTQDELAMAAGLSRTYIISLEAGRVLHPQRGTREKLHHALGTSDSELVDLGLLFYDEYGDESVFTGLQTEQIPQPEKLDTSPIDTSMFTFIAGSPTKEVESVDEKRERLAFSLRRFLLTEERFRAIETIFLAFAAEDHAPSDWDVED